MIFTCGPAARSATDMSPVPAQRSSTQQSLRDKMWLNVLAVLRHHKRSTFMESTWFKKSYRGAISSNICRTAFAADCSSTAPAGAAPAPICTGLDMVSDLIHRSANYVEWNFAGDGYLSHLYGKNIMHGARNCLLIRAEACQHVIRRHGDGGQLSIRKHRCLNSLCGLGAAQSRATCDACRCDHSPGNCLAMQKVCVIGGRFERMTDGMAIIQNAPESGFPFIACYYSSFDLCGRKNDLLRKFTAAAFLTVALHQIKQLAVTNHAALE